MFGERLRMLRTEKGFTMQQMAEMLGITIGSWAKYERNEAEPSFDKLVKIADIFNVSVDFLLGRTNVRNDKPGDNETNKKNYILDIEDIMMYSEIGDMARLALRQSNAGVIDEEDWKTFIREIEKKKEGKND